MQGASLNITVNTIDNKVHNISISATMTGFELKKYIHDKLCKEL